MQAFGSSISLDGSSESEFLTCASEEVAPIFHRWPIGNAFGSKAMCRASIQNGQL